MIRYLILFSLVFSLDGCASNLAGYFSAGEIASGYTYVPIDPFPVHMLPGEGCKKDEDLSKVSLLPSLPDNAVRMLVEKFDASGKVTYGPHAVGTSGESYRVTVDYINADTVSWPIWISKSLMVSKSPGGEEERIFIHPTSLPPQSYISGSEEYKITDVEPLIEERGQKVRDKSYAEFNIPVYVGIGLRLASNITVIGGRVNISGLGVIGAEAEANRLSGSLIVQTLGVNGKSIAAALPIQSELNRSTAQNAIVAVGSVKALLYAGETVVSPRVVGFYLPFPGGKPLVNALISELSKSPIKWRRPCLGQLVKS